MRYGFRTLLILVAIAPPIIGFWPSIKRQAINRAGQISHEFLCREWPSPNSCSFYPMLVLHPFGGFGEFNPLAQLAPKRLQL
jgi:hypothetical protein